MKTFALIGVLCCLSGLASASIDESIAVIEIDKQQTVIRLSELAEGQQRSFSFGERELSLTREDGDFSVLMDGKAIHPLAGLTELAGNNGCKGKKVIMMKKGDAADLAQVDKQLHTIKIHQADDSCGCELMKKKIVVSVDAEQECECTQKESNTEQGSCCNGQEDCCANETIEIDGQEVPLSSFAQVRRIMLVDEKAGLLRLTLLNPKTD